MLKVVVVGYGAMYANLIQGCLNSDVEIVGVFYDELIKNNPIKLFFKNTKIRKTVENTEKNGKK